MKEKKTHNSILNDVNSIFIEKMWELTHGDIDNLTTIIYWSFESTENPENKYFFIKNQIFTSNYREKMDGRLGFGGNYIFIEEIDTGEDIEYEQGGHLTSESWLKIFEFRKTLESKSMKEFI